ncbi:TetR/AcrR family transcriptional regulator [Frankia sp. AgB32]|uniref:TetR/AcrR family transcriptional regulator n=1 Tax=Frankia sp. AgB32 TaxID=631119 RepID=UPI00200D6CC6|nr:TetR/AcrR family transcriptional regulator [Frankia sp. AgB32]MCK9898407.1 TetR family transcriptional regulator [Frankia sp. AgB32]
MPTGVALRDVRAQLFDAAERVLLRAGPNGLTSRAVTMEAACAKGVLHRHFTDFDTFLAELVLDRAARFETQAVALRGRAGDGTVVDNLAAALTDLFGPVALGIVGLVISRDGLRARLRQTWPTGIPVLTDATATLASYLDLERQQGRLAANADVHALAPALVGAGHLLFAGQPDPPPTRGDVHALVAAVIVGHTR